VRCRISGFWDSGILPLYLSLLAQCERWRRVCFENTGTTHHEGFLRNLYASLLPRLRAGISDFGRCNFLCSPTGTNRAWAMGRYPIWFQRKWRNPHEGKCRHLTPSSRFRPTLPICPKNFLSNQVRADWPIRHVADSKACQCALRLDDTVVSSKGADPDFLSKTPDKMKGGFKFEGG